MNPKTDEELVGDIRNGDVPAFEEIVRRYQARLQRFAYRIIYREDQTQDIVQDAFFKLYQTIDRVDTTKKFSSYIFQIAKNTAISFIRKQHKEISLETIEDLWEDGDLIEQLHQKDTQKSVHTAIDYLDKKYRYVIRLYYFDELSYEEIAKKLKLPINTVRTHLKRAKEELEKLLKNENH